MRVLVTGGMGFIGSNFIRMMLKKHPACEIVNFDKLTYAGNTANLKGADKSKKYSFIKGDVCDHNAVKKAIAGADAVVHFAAESHVDRSIGDPDEFVRTNMLGTQVLLFESLKAGVKKFVQISTDEVYGSIRRGSFKETDAFNPSSAYSASKAGADLLALAYHRTYGLPLVVTRSTNNFGPYQHPEKLIPRFVTNALRGKPLPVYGTGKNVRDWLYVGDNCEAIDLVLRSGRNGEAYNVGAGNEVPNIEITKKILKITEKPESLINFVKDRPGHDWRYSVDAKKIRSLGWKPGHSFEAALAATVKWYAENEWWWRPLARD